MFSNDIIKNFIKDAKLEFRNRSALSISAAFPVIVIIASALAAGGSPLSSQEYAILLWLIFFFTAVNGLSHIFLREIERGTRSFLSLHSGPEGIFASKLLFNIIFFFILQCFAAPAFLFFFQISPADPAGFALAAAAGGLAVSTASTILGAIASRAGGRGSLFTVISFPVMLPPLWTSIGLTERAISGTGRAGAGGVFFLLAFSGAVIFLSFLLFRHIWLED